MSTGSNQTSERSVEELQEIRVRLPGFSIFDNNSRPILTFKDLRDSDKMYRFKLYLSTLKDAQERERKFEEFVDLISQSIPDESIQCISYDRKK